MKQYSIQEHGVVIESMLNNQFKVELEGGKEIRCYLSGKMRRNKIRVLLSDKVIVELRKDILISNQIGRIVKRK